MINLIKNEFIKILNNKLNICIVIIIVFVLCTNLLYKYKVNDTGNIIEKIDYKKEQEIYKEKIEKCYNCNENTINEYKYVIERNRIKEKYGENSWQSYVFDNLIDFNNDDQYINQFENDDWKSFIYKEIENNIENKKYVETLRYRLDNNVMYGYDYLNTALDNYANSNDENGINKYIMDTKYNIYKTNDIRGILINFFNEYGTIMILILLIIFGGIITDEYNKGTIKQLFILPASRTKILISKYVTMILFFILMILFILFFQFIFGSILFGTDSLKVPVVIFNKKIQIYSVYKYLMILLIYKLPILFILPLFIIVLNIITNNTLVTVLFTFLLHITSKILLMYSNIKFIRYLINIQWDLSIYLVGKPFNMSITTSICISILYFLVLSIISIKKFNNIDIKNSI